MPNRDVLRHQDFGVVVLIVLRHPETRLEVRHFPRRSRRCKDVDSASVDSRIASWATTVESPIDVCGFSRTRMKVHGNPIMVWRYTVLVLHQPLSAIQPHPRELNVLLVSGLVKNRVMS